MSVKEGDFVLLDYTGSTNGAVFDTTEEAVAKKSGILMENRLYRPLVVAAGKGDVIPGLDRELIGMKKGGKKTVEVSPEDGYGKRDAGLIKLVPLKAFTDNQMQPYPGMPVQLDNMVARVQSVSGGRVRVDFNHELAGKTLVFEVSVVDVLTGEDEKIKALADQYFEEGKLKLEIKGKKVVASPDAGILKSKAYAQAKAYFISQVTNKFEGYSVEFVEEYKKA